MNFSLKTILASCFILLPVFVFSQELEFYRHIQPIIFNKCYTCHSPDNSAPFILKEYEDVALRSKQIKYVVENKIMPVWKADPSFSYFENQNILTEDETRKIIKWVDQGAIAGRKIKNKLPEKFENTKKPDYILETQTPVLIKNTGEESFAIVKIPYEFEEDINVEGFEFISEQSKYIHHASIYILEDIEDGVDFSKGNSHFVFPPLGKDSLLNTEFNAYEYLGILAKGKYEYWNMLRYKTHWQPGMSFKAFPIGMGFKMPKKGVILIDLIHYIQNTKDILDNIKINIYKQKSEISRFCIGSSLGIGAKNSTSSPIILMPNQKRWLTSETVLPADMALFELSPHMHNIGRKFISYAVTPENDTIPLIRINDWDMSWQETYRFNPLLKLTKGTKIIIEGYYDNTSDNPKNPFNPPQMIRQSMNKQDEMLLLNISFFEYKEGDELKKLIYQH